METATKPRLNVIKGGGSTGLITPRKMAWRNRKNKRAHLKEVNQTVIDQLNCRAMQRCEVGQYESWLTLFSVALVEMDSDPHADDILFRQKYLVMVTRLYAGGLTAEQAAGVMYRYRYSDYPFPSRSVKR